MTHSNKFSKRILAVALLLAAWLSVDAFNVDGIYYDFVDKANRTVKVSYRGERSYSYKGEYIGDVTIPTTVIYNGVKYFVSEIDERAFEECPDLTSVTIPHTIEKIGVYAFSSCSGLTSILIPNSVKEIGSNPFVNCSNLNLIEVEDWNPKYDSRNGCNAIIETSTNTLVVGCKNTIIPNSVKEIGNDAFSGCTGLTTIDITNSVTAIGDDAFFGCTSLTEITIPKNVTMIGHRAFNDCKHLITCNFNAKNCNISWIETSSSFVSFFDGCNALKNLNIGKEVQVIPDAFFLTKESILDSITVNKRNPYFDSRDNCNAIIKTSTNTLILGCNNSTIPNSVTIIEGGAFSDCTSLTSIEIPNSVTTIDNEAFRKCSGLTEIVIPKNVTTIGSGAFYGCANLGSIVVENGNRKYDSRNNCNAIIETSTNTLIVGSNNTIIPNSVQEIGDYAFSGRSRLKNIVIPISVKEIGQGAFYRCKALESIIVEEGNRKYDSRNNCNAIIETSTNTLVVGCKNTKIPNTVTGIGDGAFLGCDGLTSILIPNSVINIGIYVFMECNGLTTITIPGSVASMDEGVFMNCKRLATVNFNAVNCEMVYSYGGRLGSHFWGCDALKTINIGNNVKYISSSLFDENGLTTITIPNSVTRVDEYGWWSLKKIIIPRGTRQKFKRIFPKDCHSKLVEQ